MKIIAEEEFFELSNGDKILVRDRFVGISRWYLARVIQSPEIESQRPTLICKVTDSRWKRERDQYYSSREYSNIKLTNQNT